MTDLSPQSANLNHWCNATIGGSAKFVASLIQLNRILTVNAAPTWRLAAHHPIYDPRTNNTETHTLILYFQDPLKVGRYDVRPYAKPPTFTPYSAFFAILEDEASDKIYEHVFRCPAVAGYIDLSIIEPSIDSVYGSFSLDVAQASEPPIKINGEFFVVGYDPDETA